LSLFGLNRGISDRQGIVAKGLALFSRHARITCLAATLDNPSKIRRPTLIVNPRGSGHHRPRVQPEGKLSFHQR
jgi:hypothetical protein